MTEDKADMINAGYVQAMFDNVIIALGRILDSSSLSESIHKAIDDEVMDEMNKIYKIKNGVLAELIQGRPFQTEMDREGEE